MLRRLGVPPFAGSAVYETDAHGHIVGIGVPGHSKSIDSGAIVSAFETRFGVLHANQGDFKSADDHELPVGVSAWPREMRRRNCGPAKHKP